MLKEADVGWGRILHWASLLYAPNALQCEVVKALPRSGLVSSVRVCHAKKRGVCRRPKTYAETPECLASRYDGFVLEYLVRYWFCRRSST